MTNYSRPVEELIRVSAPTRSGNLEIGMQNTEDRPDIVFFDSESGHDIELDISLVHPWSLDTIR